MFSATGDLMFLLRTINWNFLRFTFIDLLCRSIVSHSLQLSGDTYNYRLILIIVTVSQSAVINPFLNLDLKLSTAVTSINQYLKTIENYWPIFFNILKLNLNVCVILLVENASQITLERYY